MKGVEILGLSTARRKAGLFVLVYEEPTLRRTFGAEYVAFRANLPRWIPRVRPWQGRPVDG